MAAAATDLARPVGRKEFGVPHEHAGAVVVGRVAAPLGQFGAPPPHRPVPEDGLGGPHDLTVERASAEQERRAGQTAAAEQSAFSRSQVSVPSASRTSANEQDGHEPSPANPSDRYALSLSR